MIPLEAILNLVVRDLATAQLEPSAAIVSIKYQNMRGFMVYVITGQINFTIPWFGSSGASEEDHGVVARILHPTTQFPSVLKMYLSNYAKVWTDIMN